MKIFMGIILIMLFSFTCSAAPITPPMLYCVQADEEARQSGRKSIAINKDGTFRNLMDNRTCNEQGFCVVSESYEPCGVIKQAIDADGDGRCDYVIEWQAIVDPVYGALFYMTKVLKKCPTFV